MAKTSFCMTTFISKANERYNNKFDYSKSHYTNRDTPLKIICHIHGEFEQLSYVHLRSKHGCPKCVNDARSNDKTMKVDEFVHRAKEIHNDKYDYTSMIFNNATTKINIECHIHGKFKQTPSSHLKGVGCPQCGNIQASRKNTLSQDEFESKANKIHGDKYDYTDTMYIKSDINVLIECPTHGKFSQRPHDHLAGSGCPICGTINRRMTNEEFISKANKVHNNKYDYTYTKYTLNKDVVVIHCTIHGEFTQLANDHLCGCGCPICGGNLKSTTHEFISKATLKHNNRYDYSLVKYISAHIPITIICPTHGTFKQRPSNHLSGYGCRKCSRSKGEIEIDNYLQSSNLPYFEEYIFDDCKFIRHLPFDFYIPSLNMCIEYDGEQHFRPMRFGGDNVQMIEKFNQTQRNDSIKNQYCNDNNIRLIRIPYTEFNNIETILEKEILKSS